MPLTDRLVEAGTRNWAPRVGWRAARLRVTADVLNLGASLLTFGFLILLGVGTAASSGALIGAGVAIEVVAVVVWAISLRRRNEYRHAASDHLGIRVSGRVGENVPRDKGRYEEWCRTKGIAPYAAATDAVGPSE